MPKRTDTTDSTTTEKLDPALLGPSSTTAAQTQPSRARKAKRSTRQLSDQQLAKKRLNDREAQRAIRERTRQTIDYLQQRVQQLESGEAYAQLQDIVNERDALRAENHDLKQKLASAFAALKPQIDDRLQNESAANGPT